MREVTEYLLMCRSVAIFVHLNPDWDCVGSAFALREILREKNIKCDIFTQNYLSDYLGFLGNDTIAYTDDAQVPEYECYCCIDVSTTDRIGDWGKFFEGKENTVCIDHHHTENCFAKVSYIDSKRSSAGELIYELSVIADASLSEKTASFLYCAISADTGSFQYSSVNRRTYEIVIALTDTGIDTSYLCSMLYERKTLKQLKLQAEAIESIEIYGDGRIAVSKLSWKTQKKYNAEKSDTDGLAQIPRTVDGVMLSAFLIQQEDGKIRVSLRALGDYNIEPVAKAFGGGGHMKAAGCIVCGMSLEDTENKIVNELLKL